MSDRAAPPASARRTPAGPPVLAVRATAVVAPRPVRGLCLRLAGGLALGLALAGCVEQRPRPIRPADDLRDPSPTRRLEAVAECARTRDTSQVEVLIELLDDDDASVRMIAGRTLLDLTGRDTGYRAFAPPAERRAQVEDWRRWRASPEGQAAIQRLQAPRGTGR